MDFMTHTRNWIFKTYYINGVKVSKRYYNLMWKAQKKRVTKR